MGPIDMSENLLPQVAALMRKGVSIPVPHSIFIAEDVDIERISGDGVVIHAGAKIMGEKTLILRDSTIGSEGPVTIELLPSDLK